MAIGAEAVVLDPARDTLANVDAFGYPMPSARFMGGRRYETLGGANLPEFTDQDVATVLKVQIALLPSVQTGLSPFPTRKSSWVPRPPQGGEKTVAVSFYLALMTARCLELVGAKGPTQVEGPFRQNELFLKMLSAATGRPVKVNPEQATGTSIGAALLFAEIAAAGSRMQDQDWEEVDPSFGAYAENWRRLCES